MYGLLLSFTSFITFSNYTAKIQSLDLCKSSSVAGGKSEEGVLQNHLPFGFLNMVEARDSSSGSSQSSTDASHL